MAKYTIAKALLVAGTTFTAGAKDDNQKLRGAQSEVSVLDASTISVHVLAYVLTQCIR